MPHRPRKPIDQDDPITSIDWVDRGLAECLSLVESVLDHPHFDDESLTLQHSRAPSAKRFAQSHHPRWQDVDLIITATLEGHTV
jgi:hypothetical protein